MPTAEAEAPKKTRKGRTTRPAKDPPGDTGVRSKPFPEPPRSTIKNGTISNEKFWQYRRDLPEEFLPRLSIYVYREWPKLDHYRVFTQQQLQEIKAHHKRKPIKYIAQYADIDPDDWKNHLLQFHGSGIYKLLLNDAGGRGTDKELRGNVCSTIVELHDSEFTPVIEDLRILDMDDPANARFINDLRMKGVSFPGDAPKEDNDDMAASVAVETLSNAVVEMSKQKPQDNAAAAMLTEMLKASEARHMKELELAESRHNRELDAVMKRLDQAEATAKLHAAAGDPMATTDAVVKMAQAITKPGGNDQMIALLTEMVKSGETRHMQELQLTETRHAREMEMLNKRLDSQEKREAEARALQEQREITARSQQQTPVAGGASSAVKDVLSVIDAVGKLKSGVDGLGGPEGPQGPVWLEPAIEIGTKVIDAAQNMMHNWAIAKAGQGTPLPPPTVNGDGTPTQQVQQSQEDQTVLMMRQYAQTIKEPLCNALRNGVTGHQFAGGMLVNYPEAVYQFLVSQGETGLIKILQSDGTVWGAVIQFGAPRVQQFITEFLDTQAAVNEATMLRSGQSGVRPTVQMPPPAGRPAKAPPVITVDATPTADTVVNGQAAPAGRTVLKDGKPVQTAPPGPAA